MTHDHPPRIAMKSSRLRLWLLASLALQATHAIAQVRSYTLGIDTNCPSGLSE